MSRVLVVGAGGGSYPVLQLIVQQRLRGVGCIYLDTLPVPTSGVKAVQIGKGRLGSGGRPEAGRAAALYSEKLLGGLFSAADRLYLVAMLGGGTGSGALPVMVSVGRRLEKPVKIWAARPYTFEGQARQEIADAALAELEPFAYDLTVIEADPLLRFAASPAEPDLAETQSLLSRAVGWQILSWLTNH